jgi:gliding motility associated protien GldN
MRNLLLIIFLLGTISQALAQPINEKPENSPYKKHLAQERRAVPYDHVRQADVFWEKRIWRVIDCKQKINLPFTYPKGPLMEVISDAIKNEGLPVYSKTNDDFSEQVSASEVFDRLEGTDTLWTKSPKTLEDTMIITEEEFDLLSVQKYEVQEVWFIDKEASRMKVRIMGIAPIRDVYDDNTGEYRGQERLFWIYYPEARQILANADAYNPYNGAISMSWESILEMRFFDSYVTKEENVHDRSIEAYATGIDALLESKKIEKELFDMEQGMWSY